MISTGDRSFVTVTRWRALRSHAVACLAPELGLTAPPIFVVLPFKQSHPATQLSAHPKIKPLVDQKEALMDDQAALSALYAEFAEQDQEMAQAGMEHYVRLLWQEESRG